MSYVFLAGAILFEVIGTLLLPVTQNFTRAMPTVIMITCYAMAFLLSDIRYPRYPDCHCVCHLEWHRSLFGCCLQCLCLQTDARVAGDCGARVNYFGCCLGECLQRIASWLNQLFKRIVEKRNGAINVHQLIDTK